MGIVGQDADARPGRCDDFAAFLALEVPRPNNAAVRIHRRDIVAGEGELLGEACLFGNDLADFVAIARQFDEATVEHRRLGETELIFDPRETRFMMGS